MTKRKMLVAAAMVTLAAGGALAQQENRGPAERNPSGGGLPHSGAQQQPNRNSGAQLPSRSEPSRSEPSRSEQGGRAGESRGSVTTGQAPQEHPSQGGVNRTNRGDRERPAADRNEQPNRAGQNERQHREERGRSTTGQATPQGERRNDNVQINRDRENGLDRDRTTIDRDRVQGDRERGGRADERGGRIEQRGVTEGRGAPGGGVNLSTEQRTRIHEVVINERSAPRVNSVDFALRIGTPVPRSVRLVAVPRTFVEIEPRWRGFEYFLVGDEIVIVNPRTMEIVAVIPA
jgi:hypothetical protein